MASTVPAKSQPLHSFALPRLKWKNSHANICLEKDDQMVDKFEDSDHVAANLNVIDNKGNDTSKIMIKNPGLKQNSDKNLLKEEEDEGKVDDDDDEPVAKIWDLRPRRIRKKLLSVSDGGGKVGFVEEKKDELKKDGNANNRGRVESRLNGFEKEKKVKFSMSLTIQEIEEDVYSFTGSKAARRPRKRPRPVQKHLDSVFPGLGLGSITRDSYKVHHH